MNPLRARKEENLVHTNKRGLEAPRIRQIGRVAIDPGGKARGITRRGPNRHPLGKQLLQDIPTDIAGRPSYQNGHAPSINQSDDAVNQLDD
ncbi:hypothetical protein GCM10029964_005940 [Kibdelosporangium lantanae]